MSDEMRELDPDISIKALCKVIQIICRDQGINYVNISIEPDRMAFYGYSGYEDGEWQGKRFINGKWEDFGCLT